MEHDPLFSPCSEVFPGERIDARRKGTIHFTGTVIDTMPELGLFWAVSEIGERRLIEFSEYEIHPSIPTPSRTPAKPPVTTDRPYITRDAQ